MVFPLAMLDVFPGHFLSAAFLNEVSEDSVKFG